MKVPLSWLRDFIPTLEMPVAELADTFSGLGLECDGVEHIGASLDGIVVAKILSLSPHPDADKIQIVTVDPGGVGYPEEVPVGEPLQICCGAFNMAVGDLVPLATLGTTMPGADFEIARRKMRGEWSNGMLCSSRELQAGDDHGGIMILTPGIAPLGTPIATALGMQSDVVFDLAVNPNRPDAMSILGIARDLAAHLGLALVMPSVPSIVPAPASDVSVTIEDSNGCGRFHAWVLRGMTVEPSPEWMQRRLTMAGMRPISNVVDVSNYVMLELGRPNHTFDLARLPGRGIRVRRANAGETLVTLDGITRTCSAADLLVCDATNQPTALAGVMGGESSEITNATTEVLLEQAWWDPMTIARTSKRIGLRTDASARFERGTDWEIIPYAAARFVGLLGGNVDVATIEEIDVAGNLPLRPPIAVRVDRVNATLGTNVASTEMVRILNSIGFSTTGSDNGVLTVSLPAWRLDSSAEIDVTEEIARHYGYANIVKQPVFGQRGALTALQLRRRRVAEILHGWGAFEAMPNPFINPADVTACGLDDIPVQINDPIVADESVLRPSMRPGLLRSLAYNQARRQPSVSLYEIGKVFGQPVGKQLDRGVALPNEREFVTVVMAGSDASDAVRLVNLLCASLGNSTPRLDQKRNAGLAGLHPGRSATVMVGRGPIGVVGEIDPRACSAFGVTERVAIVELDLIRLHEHLGSTTPVFKPVSKYPSSDIVLAFVVPDSVTVDAVKRTLHTAAKALVKRCDLFDVFRGASVPAGHRSLAFTLRVQAVDHTLGEAELAEVRASCIAAVEAGHKAALR